jgi:hypothetical protein
VYNFIWSKLPPVPGHGTTITAVPDDTSQAVIQGAEDAAARAVVMALDGPAIQLGEWKLTPGNSQYRGVHCRLSHPRSKIKLDCIGDSNGWMDGSVDDGAPKVIYSAENCDRFQ